MVQKTKKNQAKASAPSIAFRLRHIEHTLSLSIALLTALTTVLIHPFSLLAWSAVGIALLVSFWSHTYPAKTYASMVTRSLVLLFMAVLLHTDTQLGGAHGTYFYWTLAICLGYALLLDPLKASALALLCLAEFLLVAWFGSPHVPLATLLSSAGLLVVFPVLAITYARSSHDQDATTESKLTDSITKLYNAEGFFSHGAVLFKVCQREKRTLSLAVLQFQKFAEVRDLLGSKEAREILLRAVAAIAKASQGQALSARTAKDELALLLPGMSVDATKILIASHFGSPATVSVRLHGRTAKLLLDTAVLSAEPTASSLEVFYDLVKERLQTKQDNLHKSLQQKPEISLVNDLYGDSDLAGLSRLQVNSTLPMPLDELKKKR